uniref:Uncharacterized protein n=1 Tax=Nelumbo nucifera TaxID=4432 RepID=A0A822ZEH1_NELNU|nr:TPA_asm: hypothetical protein HUJ06_002824 [Nelumbo nucifera]
MGEQEDDETVGFHGFRPISPWDLRLRKTQTGPLVRQEQRRTDDIGTTTTVAATAAGWK